MLSAIELSHCHALTLSSSPPSPPPINAGKGGRPGREKGRPRFRGAQGLGGVGWVQAQKAIFRFSTLPKLPTPSSSPSNLLHPSTSLPSVVVPVSVSPPPPRSERARCPSFDVFWCKGINHESVNPPIVLSSCRERPRGQRVASKAVPLLLRNGRTFPLLYHSNKQIQHKELLHDCKISRFKCNSPALRLSLSLSRANFQYTVLSSSHPGSQGDATLRLFPSTTMLPPPSSSYLRPNSPHTSRCLSPLDVHPQSSLSCSHSPISKALSNRM